MLPSSTPKILLSVFFMALAALSRGQGCSDAGFCSAGVLQSGQADKDTLSNKNHFGISLTTGSGEQGTSISIFQIEGSIKAGRHGQVDISLPFIYASGGLGQHGGIGDPIITYSYSLQPIKRWQAALVGGLRVSTGNAAAKAGAQPLPMPYQANLGTTDFIGGINLTYARLLSVGLGLQQPLIQYNENEFITSNATSIAHDQYFSSRQLRRKGDVLLRLEGSYHRQRWTLSAGPLFIYHLGNDAITSPTGQQLSLTGSHGLTLNAVATLSYRFPSFTGTLQLGTPFIVRDYRPDGLTRAWVATLRFNR